MKAAIYCRLSKEDAAPGRNSESESIKNQKAMLVQYALEQGFDIYQIYCDEDYSGADRNRPDFNRMIEAASRHRFDVVLAKTQSRFTRDMELVEKYLHGKFVEWGIRFIAVVDHADTNDIANKKSRQINGLINEWYLEDLSANVRSVLTYKRQEGKYIATFALFGYQKDPNDKNHLVIDPEAAEIVRRIFALYLQGNGANRIARILNEQGVPTPTAYKRAHGLHCRQAPRAPNGEVWGRATVYRMLRTQTYAGNLEQGRHKKVSYKSQKTIWLPREDWIVVPNTHEPIIDPDTFWRVQEMLSLKARGSRGDGTVYPLAGKVRCSCCGNVMERCGSGKRKDGSTKCYLRCRMHQRAPARCANKSQISVEALQAEILRHIQGYAKELFDPDQMDLGAVLAAEQQRAQARQAELERLRGEISRRRTAMRSLYLDKANGAIDEATFLELNASYRHETEGFEKRIRELENEPHTGGGLPERLRRQREQVERILQLDTLTRELVCLLVDHVTVSPKSEDGSREIEIAWSF